MRWIVALAALSLVPGVAAQEGCTQAEPCLWVVDIDETGISGGGDPDASWNGTQGDWIQISVFNADDVDHTLTLEGIGLSWDVASFDLVDSAPFQLDLAGEYRFVDSPTGDAASVLVYANDAVAVQEGEEQGITDPQVAAPAEPAPSQGTPGFGIVGALLALAFVTRR